MVFRRIVSRSPDLDHHVVVTAVFSRTRYFKVDPGFSKRLASENDGAPMSETQLLKDRPGHLNLDSGQSDTLIVKGFPRTMTDEEVIKYVSVAATPVEIDLENRFAMGAVWVRFESIDMVCIHALCIVQF